MIQTGWAQLQIPRLERVLLVLFSAWLVVLTAGCGRQLPVEPESTPTARVMGEMEPERKSWVILNDMPEGTTQVEMGAEVYRLVCKICHGDRGQGLTADWLAQFDPEDRNCWQSKCHAENYPQDGFKMPVYVPAVVGPQIPGRYPNALELYSYNRTMMPWQARGTMLEAEYWAVTAYLLSLNGIEMGEIVLDASSAETIHLK